MEKKFYFFCAAQNCLAPNRQLLVKLNVKTNVKMRKIFCLLKEDELDDSYLTARMNVEKLHSFTKDFLIFDGKQCVMEIVMENAVRTHRVECI